MGGGSKRNADTLGLGTGKRSGIMWNNFSGQHAFTTGRGGVGSRSAGGRGGGVGTNDGSSAGANMSSSGGGGKNSRPRGPSQTLKVSFAGATCNEPVNEQSLNKPIVSSASSSLPHLQQPQQPGKLNLKNFAIVNDAIARMNVNDVVGGGGMSQSTSADAGRGKGGLGAMFMTMTGGSASGGSATTGRARHPPPLPPTTVSNQSTFAPYPNAAYPGLVGGLDDQSDNDCEAEYAQVQEIYPGADGGIAGAGMGLQEQQMYTFSQDTTPNKGKMRPTRNRMGASTMEKAGSGMQQPLGGSKWNNFVVLVSYSLFNQI